MRSSGFPCRYTACRRTFHAERGGSIQALNAAFEARTAHEIADHNYHHVSLPDPATRSPYVHKKPKKDAPEDAAERRPSP
jgi:hypothetical protein